MKFTRFVAFFWAYRYYGLALIFLLLLGWWFCLPKPLFQQPVSQVLYARHGELLGARIASDGQWRFPPGDSVPYKFEKAIITFEDKRFHQHVGVDFRAMMRAMLQNIRAGKVVSGGSTLSMQVIRLARDNPPRTVSQKLLEIIMATRLDAGYTKAEILALYAANAPFGGNVVGIDAASWRYYGKGAHLLSWAEAATLAVLPNSPALIHPGRNRDALRAKRDRLLQALQTEGYFDELTLQLATSESLPNRPLPLPRYAPHLLDRAFQEIPKHRQSGIRSSIEANAQKRLNELVERHGKLLKNNQIHNVAALILDVETGEAIAYTGNLPRTGHRHQSDVDVIRAARSTGSILKPILYALQLQEGTILPQTLVADIPTNMDGFRPENFNQQYSGMVAADRALIRSLNIPFVRMLQTYGVEKFHFELKKLGLSTLTQPPNHYGLTLIVGGAEAQLWELCGIYAGMARTLNHFAPQSGRYRTHDFRAPTYLLRQSTPELTLQREAPYLSAAACWQTFQAMQRVERPDQEGNWELFDSSKRIAWKTGTSHGYRDAWAIGLTPRYVVGVWAGNADGEGRPGCVGIKAAAPLLFDIFSELPDVPWFEPPFDELRAIPTCRKSGMRTTENCPVDTTWVTENGLRSEVCPYHQLLHLDATSTYQVNSSCASPLTMQHQSYFILPPTAAYYYRRQHPDYAEPPPLRADCVAITVPTDVMELVYPKSGTLLSLPIGLDGKKEEIIFEVAHRTPESKLFWHLNGRFIGTTIHFHNMALQPPPGKHQLTLVDEAGNRIVSYFEIER